MYTSPLSPTSHLPESSFSLAGARGEGDKADVVAGMPIMLIGMTRTNRSNMSTKNAQK